MTGERLPQFARKPAWISAIYITAHVIGSPRENNLSTCLQNSPIPGPFRFRSIQDRCANQDQRIQPARLGPRPSKPGIQLRRYSAVGKGVSVIRGRILDERYTRLLMTQTDLDLGMIMLLDKVQKRQAISANENKRLKAAKLVEGRYPNLIVAGPVAAAAGEKAQHIRDRGFDSRYYRDLIVALIREHQPVSREDIDRLLFDKLPEVLSDEQKRNRIHNLLRHLAAAGQIYNDGSRRLSRWVLVGDGNNQ